jgi:hypothetical protein
MRCYRFFKRLQISEMDVLKLDLEDSALIWTHANNTLILSYAKPHEVQKAEALERQEVQTMATASGDTDCKQQ